MLALKYLLKHPFHILRNPAGRELLRLFWRYGDKPRYQPTNVTFGRYRLEVPDAFSWTWQYEEIYMEEFYKFNASTPAPVIYDCGANVGMSIIYLKELYPQARIKAYEAEPTIADYLTKNLQTNGINDVTVIRKAVWKDDAGVWFGEGQADDASIYGQGVKKLIPSVRLRDELALEERVDFLKIDIEGAETDVLPDCADVLDRVQHLFVEFHAYIAQPQALGDVIGVIEKAGFRYYIDTNQHRKAPFVNRRYRNNDVMDLQLNISAWRV
ncbi:FkbM family methyltransferase [Runella sp.]|uniref:FkbM family methyltransferase n=1 Tax=Runella sp. TaxID=1960881 RepID=UPI003D106041